MPRSLLRQSQIRRLGTVDVQESEAAYAEGRYFEANCLTSDEINHFVRVTGNTLGVPDVTRAEPLDELRMPAVGVIVQKPTATTCLVQVTGQILSFTPVTAGVWYYVGTDSYPSPVAPASPAVKQVIGLGLDSARLLLRAGFGLEPTAVAPIGDYVSVADFLLDCEPADSDHNYTITRVGGLVTNESWTSVATGNLVKTIAYFRVGDLVASETRSVYGPDGLVVVAQLVVTYARTGGEVTGAAYVRTI